VQGLETIELPNQLISVLGDPLLQKLMLLKPDPVSYQRISNWVVSYADDILNDEKDGVNDLAGFLEVLQQYVSATKVRFHILNWGLSRLTLSVDHTACRSVVPRRLHGKMGRTGMPNVYTRDPVICRPSRAVIQRCVSFLRIMTVFCTKAPQTCTNRCTHQSSPKCVMDPQTLSWMC
jgi:hypothetical protein